MCLGAGLKRSQELTVGLMAKTNFYFGRNERGREKGKKEGRKSVPTLL